ncbi:GNAT family N-acetyltransferase [Herbaspirillum sp. LeCh32-8]|uniref:GNAT family N-acetyltransferase n=1 Tax=Herbaspirillum sp. LeCh32-8 TaxID=2821356 RepID=UPI001AE2B59E|nr:GNAT family N-acetyltransferase [Herbaspirillum sp. LeCh32-8]MBP0596774.1 GNAT family N-acetyltransferase [Herbaspirillum sp. LeCh32-8]
MDDIHIRRGYLPGAIGRVAELHAAYYTENWSFGVYFEARVATELSAFLSRYDDLRDGFWTATVHGRIEGSLAIDGHQAERDGARLRWFIASDKLRGRGVGDALMREAVQFCRDCGYPSVYLWTFEGLHAAHRLYRQHGFELVDECMGTRWGVRVNEQKFELQLEDLGPAQS